MILVISPHFDDAVFSLGEHIIDWRRDGYEVTVLTVFGGIPSGEHCARVGTYAAEHFRVMNLMEVEHVELHYFDDASRVDPLPVSSVTLGIQRAVDDINPFTVVCPTGLVHPDHVMVREAVRGLEPGRNCWVYDELPYYVLYPEAVRPYFLPLIGCRDWDVAKWTYCLMYESQTPFGPVRDELQRCLKAPERLWGKA